MAHSLDLYFDDFLGVVDLHENRRPSGDCSIPRGPITEDKHPGHVGCARGRGDGDFAWARGRPDDHKALVKHPRRNTEKTGSQCVTLHKFDPRSKFQFNFRM